MNPINFAILSQLLSKCWKDLRKVCSLSKCSGSVPRFPKKLLSGHRAIESSTLSEKRRSQKHLASVYPQVLQLDISRFYDSVYTHSLPWAILGKSVAKSKFKAKTLKSHWSDQLDRYVRNCNSQQTIGLPIGPDTSRILSEVILARIDASLCGKSSGIKSKQVYHAIDDYQFGVSDTSEADKVQSLFVKLIRQYELRLNDFKTKINGGLSHSPGNWQREFDQLANFVGSALIERYFDLVYKLMLEFPDSNIVGYANKRFAKKLLGTKEFALLADYLQRLLLAAPHLIRWIAPLYLGLLKSIGVSSDNKRVLISSAEACTRRNDVGSTSWYLYSFLYLNISIPKLLYDGCFALSCPLIDL